MEYCQRSLPSPYVAPGLKMPIPKEELPDAIIKIILEYTGFQEVSQIIAKSRWIERVYARQLCFYFLKSKAKMSLKAIGEKFERDHTTVIHGISSIKDMLDYDSAVQHDINRIQEQIQRLMF